MKRCDATLDGQQCGLFIGHTGNHTMLIPSDAPWFPDNETEASFRESWRQAMTGQTRPIKELWALDENASVTETPNAEMDRLTADNARLRELIAGLPCLSSIVEEQTGAECKDISYLKPADYCAVCRAKAAAGIGKGGE